jgi:hypothetical protein
VLARRAVRSVAASRLGGALGDILFRAAARLEARGNGVPVGLAERAVLWALGGVAPVPSARDIAILRPAAADRPAADLSLVVLYRDEPPPPDEIERWRGTEDGLSIQVIYVALRGDSRAHERVAERWQGRALVGVRIHTAGSSRDLDFPRAANLGGRLAAGQVVAVVEPALGPGAGFVAPLLRRFRDAPDLGAALGPAPVALAVRADLWKAIRGLDEWFRTRSWAVADLCARVLALGYEAPAPRLRARSAADWRTCARAIARETDGMDLHAAVLDPHRFRSLWHRSGELDRAARRRAVVARGAAAPAPIVVYTAISGAYDTLREPPSAARDGARFVAFLDGESERAVAGRRSAWQSRPLVSEGLDAVRSAKVYKVVPHRYLPDERYTLWIDGSVSIDCPFALDRLAALYLADADLCVFRHPMRSCLYEEAEVCRRARLDGEGTIDRQIDRYRRAGYPRDAGLVEASVILRRHTAAVRELDEAWWEEIRRGSRRDQLSFNFVAWKLGFRYATFPLHLATANGLFTRHPHAAGTQPTGAVPDSHLAQIPSR